MPLHSYFQLHKLHRKILRAAHVMGPTLAALAFAGVSSRVSHAQGTMDFSGAQTLMGTFKTFAAFLRRADEVTLSRMLVESVVLLAASRCNATAALRDVASAYKVDTDAITLKVQQEYTAREKARGQHSHQPKPQRKRPSCPSSEGRIMLPLLSSLLQSRREKPCRFLSATLPGPASARWRAAGVKFLLHLPLFSLIWP